MPAIWNNSGDSFQLQDFTQHSRPLCATASVEHLVLTLAFSSHISPLPLEKMIQKSPGSQLCSDRTQLNKSQVSSYLLS